MHKMADFDFYTNDYLGTAISEKAFPELAAQAAARLDSYLRKYQVRDLVETSRKMAICAMAEVLQDHRRRTRHTEASVGSVRVRQAAPALPLEHRLWQAANVYLDFYRGVG